MQDGSFVAFDDPLVGQKQEEKYSEKVKGIIDTLATNKSGGKDLSSLESLRDYIMLGIEEQKLTPKEQEAERIRLIEMKRQNSQDMVLALLSNNQTVMPELMKARENYKYLLSKVGTREYNMMRKNEYIQSIRAVESLASISTALANGSISKDQLNMQSIATMAQSLGIIKSLKQIEMQEDAQNNPLLQANMLIQSTKELMAQHPEWLEDNEKIKTYFEKILERAYFIVGGESKEQKDNYQGKSNLQIKSIGAK